jgi:ABC-type transporter Mla subunit MlaD
MAIDARGALLAPRVAVEDDEEKKGFLLVVDSSGRLLRSPHTVQSIGSEINAYLAETQTHLRTAVQDVQKGDEAALNKIVSDLNLSLGQFQQTKKKDIDHIWSKLDPLEKQVGELRRNNQYLMIMTIALGMLSIGLSYSLFRK